MARTILTALLIVLVNVLVACNSNKVDKSSSKLMMVRTKTAAGNVEAIQVAGAHETDIVEQVLVTRQAYRQGLEALIEYYTKEGNSMKVEWAKRELAALDKMPQYNYIVEASLAGPDLRATDAVRAADYLYEEALALEKKARGLVLVVNAVQLRQALDKYNELITTYPSSDKIDDAAYQAAGIYEHFQDYTIAALYYQRAHQWDPSSAYPAVYKAAYILDRRLHLRAEAMELYQQALKKESLWPSYREFAEMRIAEFTKGDEGGE
ncbi:MAG: tetratricopeptide repeat protein [Planctomycetota bacterium]|jgi:tetratricopeptide (TPR) repeat protein